jgi:PAS domain S-box-containing protein
MRLINTLSEIEKFVESFANLDSLEVLIDTIKTQLELVAQHDTTGLYLYNEKEHKLKLFYAKGFSKVEKANAELTAMQRHPGHVFRTGEILWVNDQDTEHNPFSIDSIKKSHTRSRLYVPVKSNNKIIGAFGIQSERPHAFDEKHLAVLKVFASLAGNAYLAITKNNLIKKQNEENRKLSYLATHTPNNVIYADKDGKITWVNEHFEHFTGYNLHEILGKTPGSFLTGPETEPEKTSQLRNAIQTKTPIELTLANYKKNGELYHIAVQINPVFDENGEFLYFISIQQDVTQLVNKKRIILENQNQLQLNMQTIKESQARYSNLLQMTHDLITSIDGQGTILYANKSWLNKLNYSLKEVLGTNIFSYIHPDTLDHCMAFFGELNIKKLNTIDISYSLISKDGNKIDIEGNVICKFEDSNLIELNSFLRDVTEINHVKKLEEFKQQEIILHNKILTEINSINFLSYVNFNSVLQDITNRTSVCLDSKRISVWSYTGHSIICEDFFDSAANEHSSGNEIFEKDFPKYFNAIKTQLIIDASDAHQNEFTKELSASYLTPLNINSMLDIPIKINNILWGVLCIEHVGEKIKWSNEDVSFSKAIADIIANTNASFTSKETANKLEQVMGSLNETVWGVSLPEYKLEYISKSAVSLYERPLENWYANANFWIDVIHPDDKERIEKESEALFSTGQNNLEYRIVTPDNKVKWIYSKAKLLNNENGIPYLMTGISGDITDRKLAEIELINYKTAIDSSAIVSITDTKGFITYANDKFCEISKYSQQELIGANHNIINSKFHSKEFFNEMWQTISSGNIWKGEIKNKAKDGSEYYVESTIIPFMSDGKPFQYIAIRYETTQLKLKEEAILNQKLFYENILNNIPVDIAVFDANHKYVFVNKEAIKDDETRNWLIGKDDFDYAKRRNLPDTFAKSRREIFNQLVTDNKDYTWLEEQKNNNETIFKERRFHAVKGENIVIGYGLNVTDLKKHELLLAESVHEKETLLGEIHHRVKNNLAIIDGMVELKKSTEPDLHLKETLSEIQSRVKTVALVHQKLYQSALFSNVNIGDYVLELIDYHRRILNKTASDQFKSNLGIKNIYTDISKAVTFGLIFNELLSNSFKYGVINNFLEISISMEIKEDKVYFIYTDSGKGLYADENSNNKGFGLNLINTLSKQLKAQINYPKENYFKIELDFSVKNIQVQIAE